MFDKNLLKQPLFEAALKPLWEKHWESSVNWQDDLQWKENDKNEHKKDDDDGDNGDLRKDA